jgi:predicted nucleic acid-binding protein
MSEDCRVASLVDTNILVYRCDAGNPAKRELARELLRKGAATSELILAHQTMVEFVNALTKPRTAGRPLLTREEAWREAEDFLDEFTVLYPNEKVFRTAILGMAAYKFSWYDAHLWAYAEHYGLPELLSEDFEHGRRYGTVRVRNPFLALGSA